MINLTSNIYELEFVIGDSISLSFRVLGKNLNFFLESKDSGLKNWSLTINCIKFFVSFL